MGRWFHGGHGRTLAGFFKRGPRALKRQGWRAAACSPSSIRDPPARAMQCGLLSPMATRTAAWALIGFDE